MPICADDVVMKLARLLSFAKERIQCRLRRRLLRLALAFADALSCRDTVKLHNDREGTVVRLPLLLGQRIDRWGKAIPLAQLLQNRFGVAPVGKRFDSVDLGRKFRQHKVARPLITAALVYHGDNRLKGISRQAGPIAASHGLFRPADPQEGHKLKPASRSSKGRLADDQGLRSRQFAFHLIRERLEEELVDDHTENGIAQELQAFIAAQWLLGNERFVCEGLLQRRQILALQPKTRREFRDTFGDWLRLICDCGNSRSGRAASAQCRLAAVYSDTGWYVCVNARSASRECP